jgi:hypothetical protein
MVVAIIKTSKFRDSLKVYLFGICLWMISSLFFLRTIPKFWWQYRDDSVIHLSETLNLVRYGSVGLSPGGRVESMSSPLNFLISIPPFLLNNDLTFTKYLDFYILITLGILGISITYTLNKISNLFNHRLSTKLLFQTLLYVLIISTWTTFGWMISGMENVLVASLLVYLIGLLINPVINLKLVIITLIFLGISRIEMPLLLIPILILIMRFKDLSLSGKIKLIFIPFGVWFIFHIVRFAYYGEIFPNTATALGKKFSIFSLLIILSQILIIFFKYFLQNKSNLYYLLLKWIFLPTLAISSISMIRINNYDTLYRYALVFFLILAFIILYVFSYSKNELFSVNLGLFITLIPLNHFIMFGPARLSAFRIVSAFVVPMCLTYFWIIQKNNLFNFNLQKFRWIFIFSVIPIAILINRFDTERDLCCNISPSDNIILSNSNQIFSSSLSKNPLPIVANPDLGKVSFSKKIVNVDLGLIGDPFLSKLVKNEERLSIDYLIDYISPDIIELHGHWLCAYSLLVTDSRFKDNWEIAWSGDVSAEFNTPAEISCPRNGAYTIWKKVIPVNEIELTEYIANNPFELFSERIKLDMDKCIIANSERDRCEYVTRAILRNRVKLLADKNLLAAVNLMNSSPTYSFDYLRVIEPRGWGLKAYKEFLKYFA